MTRPLSDAGPLPCPFCGGVGSVMGPDGGCKPCRLWMPLELWNRRASSASAGTLTKEDWRIIRKVISGESDTPHFTRRDEWEAVDSLASKLAALADKEKEKP